jgi:predicted esterase
MANQLVFIHGLESTAQGTKGKLFSQKFPQMIIENYTGDFDTRMRRLEIILRGKNNLIIVGSSYGGLMAATFALKNEPLIKKLVLLAPALNLPEFGTAVNKKLLTPVVIYHGKEDIIVDPYIVKEVALKFFSNLEHYLVDDDHSLHKTFPLLNWKELLIED